MELTHFGHSCLLARFTDGDAQATVLFDPGNFSYGFEGITGLDAILITHQHPDHADPARLPALVEATPDFSGSEVEQVVVSALYEAFDADPHTRELSTEQLLHAAKEIVPLAVTMQEKIADMREWAKTRARTASLVQGPAASRRNRDRFSIPGGDGE